MALFGNPEFNSLEDLFVNQLEDLYDAEHRIIRVLPKMSEAAQNSQLKQVFDKHLAETRRQVERLDTIFRQLGRTPERLILAQFIIFLLGWPLEWTEIIIIFVPIFLPLLHHFNIDPVFFGVMVALNIQTSFLTPPMAMSCYYLKGVAPKHVTLNQIFAGALPFVFMVFITMFLVYVFPQIAMWLPDYIYR